MISILERAHQLACSLRGHDVILHFERDRLSLCCLNCALQTPGWSLVPEVRHAASTHDLYRGPGPYWRLHRLVEGALLAATRHHFSNSFLNAVRR
jgi:hypothetical protein